MEKKLDIRDLRISFRTNNGTVKAVRGINMELNKGETLAIVGESGSGKSVTARAMLGILAPNSIVESGEIIYDGKDLMKISEEEFHQYRGNRISMIFQDPMSSLNPIMKIGKQLTEAMLLNGKANQRSAKAEYEHKIKLLESATKEGAKKYNSGLSEQAIGEMFTTYKKAMEESIGLEKAYDEAYASAFSIAKDIEFFLKSLSKTDAKDVKSEIKEIISAAEKSYNDYVVVKESSKLPQALAAIKTVAESFDQDSNKDGLRNVLTEIKEILEAACQRTKPDFFAMGYVKQNKADIKLDASNIDALNKEMKSVVEKDFLGQFMKTVALGIQLENEKAMSAKSSVIDALNQALPTFQKKELDQKECEALAKELSAKVEASIDRLAIKKDSVAYIFKTSLNSAITTYFKGIPSNAKEMRRYEKDKVKYEKAASKKKDIGKVVPPVIVDLELAHNNMIRSITELRDGYQNALSNTAKVDYMGLAAEMIEHIRVQSAQMVHKVTKEMAKNHAIELMEEVGIAEPRKRFEQYPFEFSGGMRQRIVIAIALAANPDILICDEPTTALDVTIQSQILELINRLKKERQLSIIFITHDLGVVANMADKIAVMYAGKIVEYGNVEEIFYEPKHPYTWALLSSMPDLDTKEKLEAIPGTPPNMIHPPVGDAFAARNKYAMQIDFEKQPPMFEVSPTHYAATWLLHPDAPKVDPPKIVSDRIARMTAPEV